MPTYLKIAMAIHKHNPKSQADIVKVLGVSKQYVSKQIKLLTEKEIIEKGILKLTAKGQEAIAHHLQKEAEVANNL